MLKAAVVFGQERCGRRRLLVRPTGERKQTLRDRHQKRSTSAGELSRELRGEGKGREGEQPGGSGKENEREDECREGRLRTLTLTVG